MEGAAQGRLLPVHDRDDLETFVEHHIAESRIAPDEASRLVEGQRL